MSVPQTEIIHHALLEEDVQCRFRDIQDPQKKSLYESRIVKSGIFRHSPIQVLSRKKLTHTSQCYPDPDYIACLLSQSIHSLPAHIPGKIRQILLIPEFIQNDSYLLTHLYNAEEATLACYLYPKKYNQNKSAKNQATGRLSSSPGLNGKHTGILQQVLTDISRFTISVQPAHRKQSSSHSQSRLHSWLLPLASLQNIELSHLRHCHEIYSIRQR